MKKALLYFMLLCCTILCGQQPGGTSLTVELWLKADNIGVSVNPTDSTIIGWNDSGPANINFVKAGTTTALNPKYNR